MSTLPPRFPGGRPEREFRTPQAYDTTPRVTSIDPNSGRVSGGTSVTIIGINFRTLGDGTLPTVTFGGDPATNVVVVDANTITCDTPAHDVGLVDVVVTIDGQTGTLFAAFTYYESTITAVVPEYGSTLGGTTVIIEGHNLQTGATSITFGGVAATGVTFIDSEHYSCVTPAGEVGHVDVVIHELGGTTVTLRSGFWYTTKARGADIRRKSGITIRDVLNNTPNSCTLMIDTDAAPPRVGERIEIIDSQDGDRLLFAGNVIRTEMSYNPGGQTDQTCWNVTLVDSTWRLNKYRPVGTYEGVSATSVVKNLVLAYAPGFTADNVQTDLQKVNITFDGSKDFGQCLSDIAALIGGGHWYVDYNDDVHFFHVTPPQFDIPTLPEAVMGSGPATALTAAEGSVMNPSYGFTMAVVSFRVTFLYSNGAESALGEMSDLVVLQGNKQVVLSNIPIGTAPGALTVVARRIYWQHWNHLGGRGVLQKYAQVNDNVTTTFTSNFGSINADSAVVSDIPTAARLPKKPFVAHPAGPTATVGVEQTTTAAVWPPNPPFTNGINGSYSSSYGYYSFKVVNLYRDGTYSLAGPASAPVLLGDSTNGMAKTVNVTGIPVGASVNGIQCIARFIYFATVDADAEFSDGEDLWAKQRGGGISYGGMLAYDNTSVSLSSVVPTGLGFPACPVNPNDTQGQFTWPNPDGPSLEDTDPPDDVDDENEDLLREPQVTVESDGSQVRNRVSVRGAGSTVTEETPAYSTTLPVNDGANFDPTGGQAQILTTGEVFSYYGLTEVSGPSELFISSATPLTRDVRDGSPVNNYVQVDDLNAQRDLSRQEYDAAGNLTDGIHETVIVDTSLKTMFQLYVRAYAELELFARPVTTVSYATRDPNTRSGRMVHFDLTNPPVNGDFLIQDVTIDQVHDESDQLMPRYTAKASSVKYDLTDLLLQILSSNGAAGDGSSQFGVVSSAASAAITALTPTISGITSTQIQYVSGMLTNAQVKSLNSAPVAVIPAPGAGHIIYPLMMWIRCSIVTGYNTSQSWSLRHNYTGSADLTPTLLVARNSSDERFFQALSEVSDIIDPNTDGVNKAINMRGSTNLTLGSDSNRFWYKIAYLDISGDVVA